MHKKKDFNIRSYDGHDAFYSGTDEEYSEFLKNADLSLDIGDEAEPVENTQKINLNETINLQNVIDRFKKTAGDLGQTAKSFKDSVKTSVSAKSELKKAKKEDGDTPVTESSSIANSDSPVSEKIESSMKASAEKLSEIKDEVRAMSDMPERVGGVDRKLTNVTSSVEEALSQLSEISEKLGEIENLLGENKKEGTENTDAIRDALDSVGEDISDIRQAVASVSRLNDSVFDLKNTQLNTKNAVSNLETAFTRLKKKCVLGVTVISILSAIIIALEILLILS